MQTKHYILLLVMTILMFIAMYVNLRLAPEQTR